MTSRHLNIVILFLGLSLIMTQFQNCARPSSLTPTSDSSADSSVHLITDATQNGLQFPMASAHLAEQADQVLLGGVCDRSRSGQTFDWTVSVSGSIVDSGQGACDHGQFMFTLSNVAKFVCGVTYELNVTTAWGSTAQMSVDKWCEPLAIGKLNDPPDSLGQPQTCQLEYRVTADGSDQGLCQAVCFRQNILSHLEDRPLEQCESLIEQVSSR